LYWYSVVVEICIGTVFYCFVSEVCNAAVLYWFAWKSVLSQHCFVWYSIVLLFLKLILVQHSFVFEICIGTHRREILGVVVEKKLKNVELSAKIRVIYLKE